MFGVDDAIIIAGAIVVGVLLAEFGDEILDSLKKIEREILNIGRKALKAAALFVKRTASGALELVHEIYYAANGKMIHRQTVIVEDVSEDQLPEWARKQIRSRDTVDVTGTFEEKLELTLR